MQNSVTKSRGRNIRRWEDNIKMNLKEIGCHVDWIWTVLICLAARSCERCNEDSSLGGCLD
jgi:hypothetical protein